MNRDDDPESHWGRKRESFREEALGASFEGQKESVGLRRRKDISGRKNSIYTKA